MRNVALRNCLESLRSICDDGVTFDVHVVLNDPSAEIELIVEEFQDEIKITRSPVNLGVSGGFNLGFSASHGEYLVQLQDDVIVEPGWLKYLVERADATPDAGAIGSLVMDEKHHVIDPGHIVWRDGVTQAGTLPNAYEPEHYRESYPIDYHGSAGTLIRRAAWQSVSGLDDSYFPAYYGDVDFCFRLRERGWRILLEPQSRVIHSGEKTSTSHYAVFLTHQHRKAFITRHADALASRGIRSTAPDDLEREINRAKNQPAKLAPAAPTAEELAALEARLVREPASVLRRDRDIRMLFATYLENELADLLAKNAENEGLIAEHERLIADLNIELTRVQQSRSWRVTAPLRSLLNLLRRLRSDAIGGTE